MYVCCRCYCEHFRPISFKCTWTFNFRTEYVRYKFILHIFKYPPTFSQKNQLFKNTSLED